MSSRATPVAPKPKAYSYIRFSTPEQAQGDSLRRQTELARQYAARNGLELDEELTFLDKGVSAHYGRNADTGALGAFLTAVSIGRVPQGSYLIVESLDRISRQTVRKASRTMESIVEAGVNVVDLSDGGRVYSTENLDNEPTAFLMMAIRFMRAHEESAIKSRRLLAVYEKKRETVRNGSSDGTPFTRRLPAWLRYDEERGEIVLVRERAKVLRAIYKKADAGWGQHRIAQWLNELGVAPWGLGKRKATHWHRSYVKKILSNSAVVGTFTPHRAIKDSATGKRVRKPEQPIESYFPAVVGRDLFERVAARVAVTAPRGRHANREAASIFAGVLKCVRCDGSVGRVSKGEHVYLVCLKAHARQGCKYQAVQYGVVEQAIRENAKAIFDEAPRGQDTEKLEREIVGWGEVVGTLGEEAQALVDALATEKSEAIRRRLAQKEREWERAQETLRGLLVRRDALAKPYVMRRLEAVLDALQRQPFDVVEANKALKEAAERIVLDPEAAELVIHWRHADEPSEGIPFWSKHSTVFDDVEERD